MRRTQRGALTCFIPVSFSILTEICSPLKPAELQVLRAQYEKEGPYAGVQTKFNYAWVCDDGSELWKSHLLTSWGNRV